MNYKTFPGFFYHRYEQDPLNRFSSIGTVTFLTKDDVPVPYTFKGELLPPEGIESFLKLPRPTGTFSSDLGISIKKADLKKLFTEAPFMEADFFIASSRRLLELRYATIYGRFNDPSDPTEPEGFLQNAHPVNGLYGHNYYIVTTKEQNWLDFWNTGKPIYPDILIRAYYPEGTCVSKEEESKILKFEPAIRDILLEGLNPILHSDLISSYHSRPHSAFVRAAKQIWPIKYNHPELYFHILSLVTKYGTFDPKYSERYKAIIDGSSRR